MQQAKFLKLLRIQFLLVPTERRGGLSLLTVMGRIVDKFERFGSILSTTKSFLVKLLKIYEKKQLQRLKQFENKQLQRNDLGQHEHSKDYIPLNKKLINEDTRLNLAA